MFCDSDHKCLVRVHGVYRQNEVDLDYILGVELRLKGYKPWNTKSRTLQCMKLAARFEFSSVINDSSHYFYNRPLSLQDE